MGFGGAILALNRQSALEEANRRERDARSNAFNLPSFTEMFRRMTGGLADSGAPESAVAGASSGRTRWQRLWPWAFEEPDADVGRNLSLSPGVSDDDVLFDLPLPPLGGPYLSLEKPIHWRPEYTHPDKAVPGFTHDFAPAEGDQSSVSGSASPIIVLDEDEAGPSNAGSSSASASAVETTLVCARCLDPLVLAAPNGASEDERKKCRVWALRCGHMLDGKCIAELYAPPPPAPVSEEERVTDVKGKGKGKARADPDAPPAEPLANGQLDEPAASSTDRKGKRKAVEPLESESPSPSKRARFAESAESEGNSIRSRLRSHARLAAAPDTAPSEAASVATDTQPSPPRRSRRSGPSGSGSGSGTGRGKGKGKGKARAVKKPAIEAEHEWKCPVPGCGRVHYGVRVQGEWKNDEGRGAIALFV
ncbi:hypothetical protein GSI_02355 [Ganoderma sinense ZZ0214-1]|uniref:Uncharacterized protein n=1 Tax=Ganoderma sinense ZZ0214-1 TaxID=1077348 RepID=A0A2G8SPC5_9APHY|nr:hypothetical protein GSI_02355 [Ganoderma sinense ZZ0214-1]